MKHDVEVEISPTGEVKFHARGLKGRGCLKILAELEKALGKRVAEPTPTSEMHETIAAGGQKTGR